MTLPTLLFLSIFYFEYLEKEINFEELAGIQ